MIVGTCACGNAARYVDVEGRLTCATCPLVTKTDAVRLADVPALLPLLREVLWWIDRPDGPMRDTMLRAEGTAIRALIGRRP